MANTEKKIQAKRPSNLKELKIFSNEEWEKIPLNVTRTKYNPTEIVCKL